MSTPIPDNVKDKISAGVRDNFGIDISEDLIDFIKDFQSKVIVEEGFQKLKTVRLYKLAVFHYNPSKADSKNTMRRLLVKHNNDYTKAITEFKEMGKIINEARVAKKKEERANRRPVIKRSTFIKSVNGKFTVR